MRTVKNIALILIGLFFLLGCAQQPVKPQLLKSMAEQLAIPESIAYNLIPVVKKINFLLLVGIPPLMILLFIWGVILTHRLIGPLERLEKDLKKISEGDYSIRLKIRKNDDLYPIADVINKIVDRLEKK